MCFCKAEPNHVGALVVRYTCVCSVCVWCVCVFFGCVALLSAVLTTAAPAETTHAGAPNPDGIFLAHLQM